MNMVRLILQPLKIFHNCFSPKNIQYYVTISSSFSGQETPIMEIHTEKSWDY